MTCFLDPSLKNHLGSHHVHHGTAIPTRHLLLIKNPVSFNCRQALIVGHEGYRLGGTQPFNHGVCSPCGWTFVSVESIGHADNHNADLPFVYQFRDSCICRGTVSCRNNFERRSHRSGGIGDRYPDPFLAEVEAQGPTG